MTRPEYQLIYITKGKGTLAFDKENEYSITAGQLFIIYPGQWYRYKPLPGTDWNRFQIRFDGSIIDTIVLNSFLPQFTQVFDVGIKEELVGHFMRANEIGDKDEISAQLSLAGIVMCILGFIVSATQNEPADRNDLAFKIEQAKTIMTENVYNTIDVKVVAANINMSYSCFRKVFKEYTGQPPANYFNELKMKKARQLLEETPHSAKSISYLLGYNSTEYFFSIFKKKTGYTPLEYRQYTRGKAC